MPAGQIGLRSQTLLRLAQQRARQHNVDSLFLVDHLGDVEVGGETAKAISAFGRNSDPLRNQIDHAPQSDFHGLVKVLVERHRNEMGFCFSHRSTQMSLLDKIDAESAVKAGLDGG